ncbi:MAG: helix-turn-helix domain-containing protein [Defluviitaleaceae bacterium]|nr:helix-turn-helix domain-containing protein [Defluviitaleaceae bacterium]
MKSMDGKDGLSKLTVGEKIYALRTRHKISQLILSELIRMRQSGISDVENDRKEYTQIQVEKTKVVFNIVGLPITKRECIIYRERIYHFRDLIGAGRLDEARVIYNEIANIDNLEPCDFHMVVLCKMIGVRFLIADKNYAAAEKVLQKYEKHIGKMNNEGRYHFYHSIASLSIRQGHYDKALNFYLKAYKLVVNQEKLLLKDDAWLYYSIAWCYSYLAIPYRALVFWQKARQTHSEIKADSFNLYIDHEITLNYLQTNQFEDAERLLNRYMTTTESIKNDYFVGMNLFGFGYLHRQRENWATAIEYFDKASKYLPDGTDNYYASLYHKIYCTIHFRTFAEAGRLLKQVKTICGDNKLWLSYFEALGHYLIISRHMTSYDIDDSVEYILNVAIPYFINKYDYLIAIDYYTLLEKRYEKLDSMMKSLQMAKAIRDLNKRCFITHGGRE